MLISNAITIKYSVKDRVWQVSVALNAEELREGSLAGLVDLFIELLAELVAAVRAGVHAWKGKNKLLVRQGQIKILVSPRANKYILWNYLKNKYWIVRTTFTIHKIINYGTNIGCLNSTIWLFD